MPAPELAPRYEPSQVEGRIYAMWEAADAFRAPTDSPKEPYTIVIPPPNITGSLHLGHALDNTLQDILIRWKRMQGYNACWVPGTDHASIGTHVVIERELKKEGLTRFDLGREKFLERVWKWKELCGDNIIKQLKLMGCSCDWSRQRFTMDEGLSRAVREHFVRLYEDGLIYRGNRIVNWCVRCRTALSDLESKHADHKGSLWHIRYPLKEGGEIVIATTRPETMLGDTAVAVNPKDDRWKSAVGRTVILPLLGREIPVIADDYVDMSFGTGALKITPAHDANDFEIGAKHRLASINILNPDGTLSAQAGPYAGMNREKARAAVVAALEEKGLLVKVEPHVSPLSHCDRCNTVLEPLASIQWWLKTSSLADAAIKAVKSGEIRLVPDNAPVIFFEWMNNIRDWCLSRQLWWGHRIPAWYCACGEIVVSRTDPDKCPKCGGKLDQDPDVLDTWFSAALWPFSTLGWPDETPDLKRFYPTSVLITGWDIIFFWVARMMMAGLKLTGKPPFRTVVMHSLVTDPEGKKMSKSKGNIVDPLELFDRYGTDAVRFTLTSLESLKQSFRLSDEKVERGRNFMNKVWNAARFALAELKDYKPTDKPPAGRTPADVWITARAAETAAEATKALEEFAFDRYAGSLERFFWTEFCDVYIELAKPALKDPGRREAALWTLRHVLDTSMRLLHPVVPFISEEIWQMIPRMPADGKLLIKDAWPDPQSIPSSESIAIVSDSIRLSQAARTLKAETGIATNQRFTFAIRPDGESSTGILKGTPAMDYMETLAFVQPILLNPSDPAPTPHVSMVIPGYTAYLQLPNPADPAAEKARLAKERDELAGLRDRRTKELANEAYVAKAPAELVEETRNKVADYSARIIRLEERLKQLA